MTEPASLRVEKLTRDYGALRVLDEVSFAAEAGTRHAIIGPNGAGKTTLFNVISGELRPNAGTVRVDGQDVTGLAPHKLSRLGVARTWQRNNLFAGLPVLENVRLAAQSRTQLGRNLWRLARQYRELTSAAETILKRMGLYEQRHSLARHLSYGELRQLEIGIALATLPRLLLLDEPTAGMSPHETRRLVDFIAGMPRDITLLIIEHDMDAVFALADQITVLHHGQVLATGRPEEVKGDSRVRDVYLGGSGGTPQL